jgi:starch phosphorylase
VECLRRAFVDNLFFTQARTPRLATPNDYYLALAFTLRDRLLHRWYRTMEAYLAGDVRAVAYLSAEFLPGPHLENALLSLGIRDRAREAVAAFGLDLEELLAEEEEPGLGNGGLGRLAACYLDSLATLEIPAFGYGIRYEFGIFDQEIRDGWQVEITDKWLRFGNPWEISRPEIAFDVQLGGRTESHHDSEGRLRVRWIPDRVIKGVAYDTPIPGYRVTTTNLLRLWKAEAPESFDFQAFNVGDYYGAVSEKVFSENITKVLYPNDEPIQGKRLRLEQQYFFVSCSLRDMIRIHFARGENLDSFHEKWAVQLNDTHPSIAVAELMRLLVDEYGMEWERAWSITRNTFAYTNHTLLPEALEKWSVALLEAVLPRHLEIVYEINSRFLDEVRIRFPGDTERVRRMSLVDETGERSVRMAHLATVGSRRVNGVARLHTELVKESLLRDFHEMWPDRIVNVTNGVTPRRWIALADPGLAALLTRKIGDGWVRNLDEVRKIEDFVEDVPFRRAWRRIQRENKVSLARRIRDRCDETVDPDSLFDIQVKRIHEYKRQHLNVLHVIDLYRRLKEDPSCPAPPRTVIFGGKAAPGYFIAKLVIKLIHSVGEVVNRDPAVRDRLKVIFLPDYNVKNSEPVYPAADLSEQISLAGKEASGTGNMKFAMNGALTIGTLDGANVEIREAVGSENFFLFGLTADQVREVKSRGYHPWSRYNADDRLRHAIDWIRDGFFSHGDTELFRPLVDSLLHHDEFMVLEDFGPYLECQGEVDRAFLDPERWTTMSILNAARMGAFSSDRSIREYCERIWNVEPVPVPLEGRHPTEES